MNPVAGGRIPTSGVLSFMYYRGKKANGEDHYHRGIDIVAPRGTPVSAADGGVVTQAVDAYQAGFRGYGKVVVIRSDADLYYLYAHLDRIDVKKGQRVSLGQQLGTVGYTAYTQADPTGDLKSRAAHLHFEISDKPYPKMAEATRLDPVPILASLPAAAAAGGGLLLALAVGGGLWWWLRRRQATTTSRR